MQRDAPREIVAAVAMVLRLSCILPRTPYRTLFTKQLSGEYPLQNLAETFI